MVDLKREWLLIGLLICAFVASAAVGFLQFKSFLVSVLTGAAIFVLLVGLLLSRRLAAVRRKSESTLGPSNDEVRRDP